MPQDDQQLHQLLDAEKREFLAVMSHELRTPMTGVKGYLSMILDGDVGEISPEVKEYIAEAYVANDRLIRLVERMMKITAVLEGKIKVDIKKVDLVENIELLCHDFGIPAEEKNLKLTYKKPSSPIYVSADPDKLREVLMNLISNAIKFTGKGEVIISHRQINHSAVVDVKDSGEGIKKQDQGKLFEIFTKTNLSLAGQQKGTGLGLYLARKLAEAQNGKVWLEFSEPEKGSVFSAAFPIDNKQG